MNYEQMIDGFLTYFTEDDYKDEAMVAKAEFFEHVGVMDEESYDYEMKMMQFSEWYLFSRKLRRKSQTPIECARDEVSWVHENEDVYESLRSHRHSLFEFLKVSNRDLYIRDLISNYKFVVKDSPVTVGFNKGEYFEARLIPNGDSFLFTRAFCFHPPQACKFIKKEIKKLKKVEESELPAAREAMLLKLFKMKNKVEQYRHVSIEAVYAE